MSLELPTPPAWMADANCSSVDPEAFYVEQGRSLAPARSVCGACKVSDACLQYALDNDERYGVWAGTTPIQRAAMKRAAA